MRIYFVAAIYGLLLRTLASVRKFTARFRAPATCAVLPADLVPLINGALFATELSIFSVRRNLYGFRRLLFVFAYAAV